MGCKRRGVKWKRGGNAPKKSALRYSKDTLIINLERVLNRYVFRCENDFNGRSEDI